jgi:hypothetical protein
LIILRIMVITSLVIGISGVLEYFVPSVADFGAHLLNLKSSDYFRVNLLRSEVIRLSPFDLWGTPVVVVALVPVLGFLPLIISQTAGMKKIFWISSCIIIIGGIILSGYRSAWLGAIVGAIVMLLLNKKYIWSITIIFIPFIKYLPIKFIDRFLTILDIKESSDPSLILRAARLHQGFESILRHPIWGTGWSSQAVFNDWLYITVALGIPAIIIFIIWYGKLLLNLLNIFKETSSSSYQIDKKISAGFLIGLSGNAFCMISGAAVQVRPLMTSFWILFCLALRYVDLIELKKLPIQEKEIQFGKNLRSPSHL